MIQYHQTYYTSCTTGLRGSKGFQFNAASEGVSPAVLEQVERLSVYVPPLSAPTRPTADELALFPSSLFFYRLSDGRPLLGLAKYVGQDYTGRYGNYFTHSFISENSVASSNTLLPVELWRSPAWATTESKTTALPMLSEPAAGAAITSEKVKEFLATRDRSRHVAALLTAAEAALSTHRRIILVDDNESVALWIAAISYSLPRNLAWQLTFTTYVKNPYQTDALVTGLARDSDFAFSPYEIEHQYSVFDFFGGRFTPLSISGFAKIAVEIGRKSENAAFARFLADVAPDLAASELTVASSSYALLSNTTTPTSSVEEILRWYAGHVGRLEPGLVRKTLGTLLHGKVKDSGLMTAFSLLYRASLAPGIEPSVGQAVEQCYLGELIEIGQSGDVRIVESALESVRFARSQASQAKLLREVWFGTLQKIKDPERFVVLILLGDKLGYCEEDREGIREPAFNVLAERLDQPGVQQLIPRLSQTSVWREIIDGLGIYLESRAHEAEYFVRIRSFFDHASVLESLMDYAFQRKAFELRLRLLRATPKSKDRRSKPIDDLKVYLGEIGKLAIEVTPSRFAIAFDIAWQDSPITLDEIGAVLDQLADVRAEEAADDGNGQRKAGLARTPLSDRLVEAVLSDVKLGEDDRKRRELLGRLLVGPLGPAAARNCLVDFWNIGEKLRSREGSTDVVLHEAIAFVLNASSNRLRSGCLQLISARLMELSDIELHRRLSTSLFEGCREPFREAYFESAFKLLKSRRSFEPQLAARLFRLWARTDNPVRESVTNPLVSSMLRLAGDKWREREFQEVLDSLKAEPEIQELWMHKTEKLIPVSLWRQLKERVKHLLP